jgi:TrmH family RNA methyltransferase
MRYRKITSASNPRVREAITMLRAGRKRTPHVFLIEGPHLIEAALSQGAEIRSVFFSGSFAEKGEGREILMALSTTASELFEVTGPILDRIAATETPQGIIAIGTIIPLSLGELPVGEKPLLIIIDGIQDPGNLGTIIRTSDAAGADAVILLPGTCDPFMPKTVRATAGSIFNIPVIPADRAMLLKWLGRKKIRLAVTSADAPGSVFDAGLDLPIALVFGNEAHGVSEPVRRHADLLLRIPIYGGAESLNVATSAAICLYEVVRQQKRQAPKTP